MRPKYKVTGCARFFIFFLFLVPVVYFGATYARGENGMQMIRDFFGKISGKENQSAKPRDRDTYHIEDLQKDLDEARQEIKELKETIREKEKEIEKLKEGG